MEMNKIDLIKNVCRKGIISKNESNLEFSTCFTFLACIYIEHKNVINELT